MVLVTKKDGSREEFLPAKIMISMIRAGVPAGYAHTIAQYIGRTAFDGITTREIETRAIRMLMDRNPEWVKEVLVSLTLPERRPVI